MTRTGYLMEGTGSGFYSSLTYIFVDCNIWYFNSTYSLGKYIYNSFFSGARLHDN